MKIVNPLCQHPLKPSKRILRCPSKAYSFHLKRISWRTSQNVPKFRRNLREQNVNVKALSQIYFSQQKNHFVFSPKTRFAVWKTDTAKRKFEQLQRNVPLSREANNDHAQTGEHSLRSSSNVYVHLAQSINWTFLCQRSRAITPINSVFFFFFSQIWCW